MSWQNIEIALLSLYWKNLNFANPKILKLMLVSISQRNFIAKLDSLEHWPSRDPQSRGKMTTLSVCCFPWSWTNHRIFVNYSIPVKFYTFLKIRNSTALENLLVMWLSDKLWCCLVEVLKRCHVFGNSYEKINCRFNLHIKEVHPSIFQIYRGW